MMRRFFDFAYGFVQNDRKSDFGSVQNAKYTAAD